MDDDNFEIAWLKNNSYKPEQIKDQDQKAKESVGDLSDVSDESSLEEENESDDESEQILEFYQTQKATPKVVEQEVDELVDLDLNQIEDQVVEQEAELVVEDVDDADFVRVFCDWNNEEEYDEMMEIVYDNVFPRYSDEE